MGDDIDRVGQAHDRVPDELAGRTLGDAHVRRRTGCNVVAVERDGRLVANPDVQTPLPADGDLILVGAPWDDTWGTSSGAASELALKAPPSASFESQDWVSRTIPVRLPASGS